MRGKVNVGLSRMASKGLLSRANAEILADAQAGKALHHAPRSQFHALLAKLARQEPRVDLAMRGSLYSVARVLEGLAATLTAGDAAQGVLPQPWWSARLLGAANHSARPVACRFPWVTVLPAYDRDVAAVRTTLGDENHTAAWAEGEALTLEQAIAGAPDVASVVAALTVPADDGFAGQGIGE